MKKVKAKPSPKSKSPSRLWLISVFIIILLLALAVYLSQNASFKAVAGEAIRQQVEETKQLALSEGEAKVASATQQGKDAVFLSCPPSLVPKEQHWETPSGWNLWAWNAVEAQCPGSNRIFCYYADGLKQIDRADQFVIYQDFPGVKNCAPAVSTAVPGCACTLEN